MSITKVSGSRRETRASLTQPYREQPAADLGDVDQRLRRLGGTGLVGRAAQLIGDDRVDQRAVHVVDADDLVAADLEAGFADRGAGGALRLGGDIQRDQHDEADREHEGAERQAGELVGARLVDRQPLGDLLRDRDFRRLPALARPAPPRRTWAALIAAPLRSAARPARRRGCP